MAVRNGCVYAGELPTSLETLYTVPAGNTFILKSAVVYNNTGSPMNFVLYLSPLAGAPGVLWQSKPLEPGPGYEWQGWHAMSSGGTLLGNSATPGVYGFFTGALLPNF
jgi:hypothetical protein